MKHKLPIFTGLAIGLGIGVASTPALRPTLNAIADASASGQPANAAVQAVDAQPDGAQQYEARRGDAQELVRDAAARVAALDSVSAKIRLAVDLFGQQLAGSGRYLQGDSTSRQFRLEMKMPLGDSFSSIQQVCDGQTLWIRRKLNGPAAVSKVELARLQAGQGGAAGVPPLAPAIGGLPGILSGLDRSFDFRWSSEASLGYVPVHVVYGQWKPAYLARMLPDQKETIGAGGAIDLSKLPQHMPDHVAVYLGRDDLFPYRIEYRRSSGGDIASAAAEASKSKPLVSMELYEPRFNSGVDSQEFIYTPGAEPVADETDQYRAGQGAQQ